MKRIANKTSWPKSNPRLEASIGRFLIAWNILEQELDFAIQEVCRLDFVAGRSITANLGTNAKLDMYQSLAHGIRDSILDETFPETVDKLANDTATASGNLRNFLFHGQPTKVLLDGSAATDFWVKFAARKGGVRGTGMRLSASYVQGNTAHIKSLIERWGAVRSVVRRAVEIMDLVDRDLGEEISPAFEITPQAQARLDTLARARRLRRQRQSRRDSPEASPTRRGKPPQSSEG